MSFRSPGTAAAWLGHPATLAAIAVLLVNDHLLKRLWPGVVTGKLSDVAGMLVAPPLVALAAALPSALAATLAVRRPAAPAPGSASRGAAVAPGEAGRRTALAAIALTGAVFALVKTTPFGARAAAEAWSLFTPSAGVVMDPADLVALPALGLAWLVRLRAVGTAARVRRAVRRARLLVALPTAVLAVTATAAPFIPPSAVHVEAHDAVIVVYTNGYPRSGVATSDQGRTWHRWTSPPAEKSSRTTACVPGEPRRCYRVVPPLLLVEQSDNGGATWTTAWEVPAARRHYMYRNLDTYEGDRADRAESMAVAVLPVPGGHLVAVANGRDGVALRDVAGRWHRLGLLGYEDLSEQAAIPLSTPGEHIEAETGTAYLVALTVLLAALGFAGCRRRSPFGFTTAGFLSWVGLYMTVKGPPGLYGLPFTLIGVPLVTIGGIVLACIAAYTRTRGLASIVAAPLTFAAIYLPYRGWSAGWPGDYGTATLLAIVLCGAAVVLGAYPAIRARGGYGRVARALRSRMR
ncbi:hypothetical protein ACQPZZ_15820 [Microbispora sp. CA-135349]|uniref:hypothetical protein n=1 Tax=Microbispora sp. CA-135349 TaxID=3239953 RepID=UPI003D9119C3